MVGLYCSTHKILLESKALTRGPSASLAEQAGVSALLYDEILSVEQYNALVEVQRLAEHPQVAGEQHR